MCWCRWSAAVAFGLLIGCQKAGEEKFTPSEMTARQVLEAALTQWRDGQAKPAPFSHGKVKVEVIDKVWADGQKLQAFEIVGEEVIANGPRVFAVTLKTAKGQQSVKYYIIGIDPLWVYGEADYRKQMGG